MEALLFSTAPSGLSLDGSIVSGVKSKTALGSELKIKCNSTTYYKLADIRPHSCLKAASSRSVEGAEVRQCSGNPNDRPVE